MWSKTDGFPRREFFAALDPRLADVVDTKTVAHDICPSARGPAG